MLDGHPADTMCRFSAAATGGSISTAADLHAFWVALDAGRTVRRRHQPSTGTTYTVLANWTDGAWPIVSLLDDHPGW